MEQYINNTTMKELSSLKYLVKSINNEITKLLSKPHPYSYESLNELIKLKIYYENELTTRENQG
jgi:hypothetical protein